jgi:sterol desaturase/sphingolipid hydroxylase (fatty acid hydroxylase superfamily)
MRLRPSCSFIPFLAIASNYFPRLVANHDIFNVSMVIAVPNWFEGVATTAKETFMDSFLDPMSGFGIGAFLSTLLVSVAYISSRRILRGRRVLPRTVVRALFPRGILGNASFRLDALFFLISPFVYGALGNWLIIPYLSIEYGTQDCLTALFGTRASIGLSARGMFLLDALVFFFFYELAFWLDHYISHNVPLFWEFHKVHHQAEVLTPMTITRCHPIDMIKFLNVVALIVSLALGTSDYIFLGSSHSNALPLPIIMVASYYLFGHLQHTRLWIPFRGVFGRVFISPAHHQIHHSTSPANFNTNLGLVLAIWDWIFGTLRMPEREREHLHFGIEGASEPHGARGSLLAPITRSAVLIYDRFVGVPKSHSGHGP